MFNSSALCSHFPYEPADIFCFDGEFSGFQKLEMKASSDSSGVELSVKSQVKFSKSSNGR